MYGGNYKKTSRNIAQDEHGNWKDVDTGLNVYHGNFQEFPSIIESGLDMLGLRKDDPYEGTWTGTEWDDEFDKTVAGKKLNMIQRWKAKKEFKAAQEQQAAKDAKDAADAAAVGQGTDIGGGWTQTNTGGGKATFTGSGGQTHKGWSNTPAGFAAAAESEASFAQGGRIGYRTAGPVLPEDENENVFQIMQDQGIPWSEQVEGEEGILQQLIAKYIEAGFPPDQAEAMAMQEFEQMATGPEQDQGIASLV